MKRKAMIPALAVVAALAGMGMRAPAGRALGRERAGGDAEPGIDRLHDHVPAVLIERAHLVDVLEIRAPQVLVDQRAGQHERIGLSRGCACQAHTAREQLEQADDPDRGDGHRDHHLEKREAELPAHA